jgi:predicted phage terminase large subunit-like protein
MTPAERIHILSDFTRYAAYMAPEDFELQFYHKVITQSVNDAIAGTGTQRNMYFMPPRHGKTTLCGDLFLTYMFGRFPEKMGLYATYNESLAEERRNSVASILASKKYLDLFPNARTRSTVEDLSHIQRSRRKGIKDTAFRISNIDSARGSLTFAGRDSGISGIGFHYAVVDDPYKNKAEAQSLKVNESVKKWFSSEFITRQEKGQIVFVFYTRRSVDDLAGMVIEQNRKATDEHYRRWSIYCFSAERTASNEFNQDSYDPRKPGEPLDLGRRAAYADAKMNDEVWTSEYQQEPLDAKGALFDISMFGRYVFPVMPHQVIISVDANFKKKSETVDQAGITVWSIIQNKLYLLHFVSRKMSYPELKAEVRDLAMRYRECYWFILVEEAANGYALIDELKMQFPNVLGVSPHGKTKRERAQYALPMFMDGGVMLPSSGLCPNIHEFIKQFQVFRGLDDNEVNDLVDSSVQVMNFLQKFRLYQGQNLVTSVSNGNTLSYSGQAATPSNVSVVKRPSYPNMVRIVK